MHAPAKSNYPVLTPDTLTKYDAVLFGFPTRYGNFLAQWKVYAGLFVSSGTLGGGKESTAIASMSTLAHHGFIYMPLGNKIVYAQLANMDEIHGGSVWGAGTFAASLRSPICFQHGR
ncbi:Minor allergen Alt a 7 [Penicillium soppii]|uniref:Minor allergen Alt a 7 n=1 Tax=Penicillium soppii TaxID=69789 RepID=UPI002547ABF9|nr:Minor allergen Alt a 7 [Penicillium soppii]KAJ5871956.1 Minor allergen Alt a 7 [Penicillium soppii]